MTATPADTLALLKRIRMDLTNAQGKLTDAIEAIAALPGADLGETRCDLCGATSRTRGGHLYSCPRATEAEHEAEPDDHTQTATRARGNPADAAVLAALHAGSFAAIVEALEHGAHELVPEPAEPEPEWEPEP